MPVLTKEEFKQLGNISSDLCISIFVKTWRAGVEVKEGKAKIGFKNQLQDIRNELKERGLKPREVETLLEPAHKLLDDQDFWSLQSDGLAMFITKDFARHYTVPLEFNDFHYINHHFYLKPLLPLLENDGRFFVLALSQSKTRLFEATSERIREINITKYTPNNLYDSLRFRDPQESVQFHSGTAEGEGTMWHGHGQGKDNKPDLIRRFFSRMENDLKPIFGHTKAPLVLAGVEYEVPIFRSAWSYENIVDGFIHGNYDIADPKEILQRTYPLVKEHTQNDHDAIKENIHTFVGTGKADVQLEEVVKKAYYGLIDQLYVADGREVWGHYDPDKDNVELHDRQMNGDYELLNYAAVQTVLKGGNAYLLEPEDMPDVNNGVAALYRNASSV